MGKKILLDSNANMINACINILCTFFFLYYYKEKWSIRTISIIKRNGPIIHIYHIWLHITYLNCQHTFFKGEHQVQPRMQYKSYICAEIVYLYFLTCWDLPKTWIHKFKRQTQQPHKSIQSKEGINGAFGISVTRSSIDTSSVIIR